MKKNKKSVYKKELEILSEAVINKENTEKNIINSPTTIKIIELLENFISSKNLICYGGMAINNILPKNKQFYDKQNELPDYDFFSTDALNDAKELADIYFKEGFDNVESKSGLHEGTYKVYVNFLQVADITQLEKGFFQNIKKTSMKMNDILYAPPNFLRMSIYLELSRPDGDISRWEKIYNRLQLLNKYHPLTGDCLNNSINKIKNNTINKTYKQIKNILIKNGGLFFGGLATNSYRQYDTRMKDIYSFDVFMEDLNPIEYELKSKINDIDIKKVKGKSKLMPDHIIIKKGDVIYATIYKTQACYSYNILNIQGQKVKIATIYTIMSMYLVFLFTNQSTFSESRLLCLCESLLIIYKKNRLKNKGILKNYSLKCYGHQETFEKIILKRNSIFEELKNNKNSEEYQKWFLRYNPVDSKKNKNKTIKNTVNSKKIKGGRNKDILYYFYFETCPYCIEFDKTWSEEIIKDKDMKKMVSMEKIHKDDKLSKKYDVQTYPSIYLLKDDDKIKFEGNRNLNEIKDFVTDS
tara:strand:+ start:1883 stop:3457 length:1575 start_codon:yes stop_codon:yes gene_type:complete